MKKRKHSPGPWGILDIPTHDSISIYQTRNPIKNFHIATCLDYATANKEASEAEFQRCLANAQLISCAPEMLEAMEFMLKELAIDNDETGLGKQRLVDVIKKAKGET
jgi:hypothetical protein